MTDDKLMVYFKFDNNDLQANRTGQVTEKQKARLNAGDPFSKIPFLKHELKVASAQGRANIVDGKSFNAETHRTSIYPELQIGGKRFMATTILADILQGDEYILYHIDRAAEHPSDTSYLYASDDILSLEFLKKAGGTPAPQAGSNTAEDDPQILALLKKGDMMGAIKRHRTLYNSSMEEAKKTLEMLKAKLGY